MGFLLPILSESLPTYKAEQLINLMKQTNIPAGLSKLGYCEHHCATLAKGAMPQRRLIENAPKIPKKIIATNFQIFSK